MSIAYLLLGSNLGDRHKHLQDAANLIAMKAGSIRQSSAVYESPAWGFSHPQKFLNQALEVETKLTPTMLLHKLQGIESGMGRERNSTGKYEARSIDIDILFYEDIIMDDTDLCIPHSRLHERKFALLPLMEINPQLTHPLLKKTVQQLWDECHDENPVEKIKTIEVGKEKEEGYAS